MKSVNHTLTAVLPMAMKANMKKTVVIGVVSKVLIKYVAMNLDPVITKQREQQNL